MTPALKRDIVNFLKQESLAAPRGKEERIAALLALGGHIDDPDAVAFLRQESLSERRSIAEKIAALEALGGGPVGAGRSATPPAQMSRQ